MNYRTLCFLIRGDPPNQVLLGFKKRGFGAGKYAGFGGKPEADESIEGATIRELEEEAGVRVTVNDLYQIGHLTFLFPAKPDWSQVVYVFLAETWTGTPQESDEMKPVWYRIDDLPFDKMWDDAVYWLPHILKKRGIKAKFIFNNDNETVSQAEVEDWVVLQR